MRKLCVGLIVLAALGTAGSALAAQPPATTFVVVLSPEEEVPACTAATNAAGGSFVGHVVDEATGTVEWKLVANNLPGPIVAAHIHVAPKGVAGPVVQALPPTPGDEHGVIGAGSFSNPALVAALRANPDGYYVNVHTTVCPAGAARGQLGDLRTEVDARAHSRTPQLGSPVSRGRMAMSPPCSSGLAGAAHGPLGGPRATQGTVPYAAECYLAGRNATWSSKATPATGWNE